MVINNLNIQKSFTENPKLQNYIDQLGSLLQELNTRDIIPEVAKLINSEIDEINAVDHTNKNLKKLLKKKTTTIIRILERKLKIIPKNYYRNLYMIIGMGAFGVSFGVAFGIAIGNMAFLGIGIPIGLALGIGIGTAMDQKALKEGRQLVTEIKY
jgi:hypothetical protein